MNAIPNDACWRRIGVRGDGSCPELRRYIHCSACPVTMRAARSLLDRTDPGATLEPAPADAPPLVAGEGALSFLVFRLGSEYFAIESSHAVEVVRPRHVQPIP
ncbi:MAG: chemotaxis protein CheW, partial [Myxococcales bacterium]